MTTALPVLRGAERSKALLDAVLVVARDGLGLPPEAVSDRTLEVLCNSYSVSPAQAQLARGMSENLLNEATAAHVDSIDRFYVEWSAAERLDPVTGLSEALREKVRPFVPVPDPSNSANTIAALAAVVRVRESRIWERLGRAVRQLGASEMQFDDAAADMLTALTDTLAPALKHSAAIADGALNGQGGVAYAAVLHDYVDSIERSLATLASATLVPRKRSRLQPVAPEIAAATSLDTGETVKRSECQLSQFLGIVHSGVNPTRSQSPARTRRGATTSTPVAPAAKDDSSDDEAPVQQNPKPQLRRRVPLPSQPIDLPTDPGTSTNTTTRQPQLRRRAGYAVVAAQPGDSSANTATDITTAPNAKTTADAITKKAGFAYWSWIEKTFEVLWIGTTVVLTLLQSLPYYSGIDGATFYELALRASNKASGIAPYKSRADASLYEKLFKGMFIQEADLADDLREVGAAVSSGIGSAISNTAYPVIDFFAERMGYGSSEQAVSEPVVTGMRYIPGSLFTTSSALRGRIFDLISDLSGLTNSLYTADSTKPMPREVGFFDQLLSIIILLAVVMAYAKIGKAVFTALDAPFSGSRRLARNAAIKLIEVIVAKFSRQPTKLTPYQLYLLREQGLLLPGADIPVPQDLTPEQRDFLKNKNQVTDGTTATRSLD